MTYFQRKGNKYNAKKKEYKGYYYASGKECARAVELDLLVAGKEIKEWKKQITLPLYFKDYKITTYRMDFVLYEKDGSITLEEIKGFETYEYKLKRNLLEAILAHPESDEYKEIKNALGLTRKTEINYVVIK